MTWEVNIFAHSGLPLRERLQQAETTVLKNEDRGKIDKRKKHGFLYGMQLAREIVREYELETMGDLHTTTQHSYNIQYQRKQLEIDQDTLQLDKVKLERREQEHKLRKMDINIQELEHRIQEKNKQLIWLKNKAEEK